MTAHLSPPGALPPRLCREADVSGSLRENGETSFHMHETREGHHPQYHVRQRVQSQGSFWHIMCSVPLLSSPRALGVTPLFTVLLVHSGESCPCCASFLTWPVNSLLSTAATGWTEFVLTVMVFTFQVKCPPDTCVRDVFSKICIYS